MRMTDKSKAKLIAKTFLCVNKGKYFTSKELCEFINNNKLGVKGGVTPTGLTHSFNQQDGITRRRKNNKNVWEYAVVD